MSDNTYIMNYVKPLPIYVPEANSKKQINMAADEVQIGCQTDNLADQWICIFKQCENTDGSIFLYFQFFNDLFYSISRLRNRLDA